MFQIHSARAPTEASHEVLHNRNGPHFRIGISMAALTSHDHTLTGHNHSHFAQNGVHAAGNKQQALLY
jgi:hypothetical protein